MPVIIRYKNYKIFFFSNEGIPREPLHIHVRKNESIAKFWIEPEIKLAKSYGMSSSELLELMNVIENNKELIRKRWDEFFRD